MTKAPEDTPEAALEMVRKSIQEYFAANPFVGQVDYAAAGFAVLKVHFYQKGLRLEESGDVFAGEKLVARVNKAEIRYDGERLDYKAVLVQPLEYINIEIKVGD